MRLSRLLCARCARVESRAGRPCTRDSTCGDALVSWVWGRSFLRQLSAVLRGRATEVAVRRPPSVSPFRRRVEFWGLENNVNDFMQPEADEGRRVVMAPAPGAVKDDARKPRTDLLPFDAIEGVAVVLDYGAQKYAARNWELGLSWGRLLAATLRHLFRWGLGEDIDPESGLPHLDHAACSVLMLSATVKRGIGTDDRRTK